MKDENIVKLEVIVIAQGNIEVLDIAYVILNIVRLKKLLKFFIMDQIMIKTHKRVSKEFKKQFACFGENNEKYINFIDPIDKLQKTLFHIAIYW